MGSKKTAAIAAASVILLVAAVAAVAVTLTVNKRSSSDDHEPEGPAHLQNSIKAIKSICSPTDFPQTCEKALTDVAGNTTDTKEIIRLAFKVAADQIKTATQRSSTLAAVEKDPMSKEALKTCRKLFDLAVDDLKDSMSRFGTVDITKMDDIIDDVKVWLSAVLTYQDTCIDGFDNVTSNAGKSMTEALKTAKEMTSNVLAIVDEIGAMIGSLNIQSLSRKLLAEVEKGETPSWMSDESRRMLTESPLQMKPTVTVAKDGSGDYDTIQQAIAEAPKTNVDSYYVIYIKEGVYEEKVEVPKGMNNVAFIGDGANKTKITGSLNFAQGTKTFLTATVTVFGDGFIAKDIGFENSAGAEGHQAVALLVSADRVVFYNCQMDGYQDTLYVHTKRQYYRNCTISGTIDFIFGNSATVFQGCTMVVRKPMDNQRNIVTAQGRKGRREPTGIVLHDCRITADPALRPYMPKIKSYLGRPWKEYSRTIIMQTEVEDVIDPEGWLPWEGDFGLKTCFYAEVDNFGAGAGMEKRVTWRGVKKVNYEHAGKYTVASFIQGNRWLKLTGVPYYPGLLPKRNTEKVDAVVEKEP